MSNSIAYLTSKANFLQVSAEVPITKQRNLEKVDPPDVFEGIFWRGVSLSVSFHMLTVDIRQ